MGVLELHTVCNRDCPDACGLIATVEDGKLVALGGDPAHPVTKGFLCYRTSRFPEMQYGPLRLATPHWQTIFSLRLAQEFSCGYYSTRLIASMSVTFVMFVPFMNGTGTTISWASMRINLFVLRALLA